MTQNLAILIDHVNQAQRRVGATTPKTLEWLDAQRAAVCARADYWQSMGLEWDLSHPKTRTAAELGDTRAA